MWLLEHLKFHMWLTCMSPIIFLMNSIHLEPLLISQIPGSVKEERKTHRSLYAKNVSECVDAETILAKCI